MALIRLIVVEIRKLELDTTIIIIITKVRHNNNTNNNKILRYGAPRLKVDEGELVECKIVIFLPLAGGFSQRRWRGMYCAMKMGVPHLGKGGVQLQQRHMVEY